MALRIESKILQDVVAELTINQECGFKISTLTGCYDCTLGAPITAICKSLAEATVTVACPRSQQFLVECVSSDEENVVILHFKGTFRDKPRLGSHNRARLSSRQRQRLYCF